MASPGSSSSDHEAGAGSPSGPLLHTEHLYYGDTELYFCAAKVIATRDEANENGLYAVVTDATVMHPQGGKLVGVEQSSLAQGYVLLTCPPHMGIRLKSIFSFAVFILKEGSRQM